ncbi:MAG: hypothetical protein HY883_05670, partial [Deltaproteobacteria bacterium]|nr:hypothetical protein [Deltaproteobacteria bacterium]
YAKELLPRAVGYSAGLINHFFRSQIDMAKDPLNPGRYVIKNPSGEPMSGSFSLYYDDTYDNRYLAGEWSLSINPGGQSGPVEFTEPTDAKEKGRYVLVFDGTLGDEEGAVVGKVVTLERGIWEPWDSGVYTVTSQRDGYVFFTLETTKHIWAGLFDDEYPPRIRVEDGIFKIDVEHTQGGDEESIWMKTPEDESIPVSGCNLKMNTPHATTSGYWSLFWIRLYMTTGLKYCSIDYGIAEASSYWDWSFMGAGPNYRRTFIGSGEVERNIADDLLAQAIERDKVNPLWCGSNYIGNIEDWHIYRVDMLYDVEALSAAIDYIDFPCE